jgi:hypothetical protein
MPLYSGPGMDLNEADEKVLARRVEDFYLSAQPYINTYWGEADTDVRFECGDQTVWESFYGNVPLSRRKMFNFNRIRRIINMVSGYQRRNRKSTVSTPVENGDEETANQFSKILMWNDQQEGIGETISEAFHGSLITGMNLLHVYMDYRRDPVNGDIKVDNCPYNSFVIDPFFRKRDLSDCTGIMRRSYLTKSSIYSLLPDYVSEFRNMTSAGRHDEKFQFMPEAFAYDNKNLLTYDEFYYRAYRKQDLLVDTQTGETREWSGKDPEQLKLFLRTYPSVILSTNDVPTVRLTIIVQGRVVFDGPNPMGVDDYPFIPVVAYYNPQIPYYPLRIQGIVRGLRDSQYLYNRRKIIELDILESQLNSGFIFKPSSLIDPSDIHMTGQGKGIGIKDEGNIATDIMQIQASAIPPTTLQVGESLGKEIEDISGVNSELLGSAIDEKVGILAMLRQGAGLTTLQGVFDNLDYAQKLLGRLRLKLIQANFTPGKVKRIIEEEPMPQFYNKAFGIYDTAIEEGLNTTTQRQMQFAQLLQLREAGIAIPDETILEAMTVQNKQKLIETVKANQEKQAQMEQMQQQAVMQELHSRAENSSALAKANTGLGYERMSRIDENQALAVERRAKAVADENLATLNMVKALKEIDAADLTHIEQVVKVMQMIKQQEQGISEANPVKQPSKVKANPVKQPSKVKTNPVKSTRRKPLAKPKPIK